MILLIVVILLCFGGFGSYSTWNHENYGPAWGGGIGISTILLILLVVFLLNGRL